MLIQTACAGKTAYDQLKAGTILVTPAKYLYIYLLLRMLIAKSVFLNNPLLSLILS